MEELHKILSSLDLPDNSRRIYIELLQSGEMSARNLAEKLSITRPSVYDHLEILRKQGLVVEKEIDNKTFWAVDEVEKVERMLEASITKLETQKSTFERLLPELLKQSKTTSPTIKFYEGKLGLTHLLNDVLWSGAKEVHTMWPHQHMIKVLDETDLTRFNKRRLQENIYIKALWPYRSNTDKDYIWSGQDDQTERRYAPKGMKWDMGYSIYGNKVSFISSEKETFGFIVNSKEFSDLMRLQFNTLWQISRRK